MRHAARIAAFAVAATAPFVLSACGSETIDLAESDPHYKGAEIFAQRCSGCHTISVVGTQGSAVSSYDKEPSDGPNFDQRRETEQTVLYALRNGGFSGKIMPPNIVTGDDAVAVAKFLAKYAGRDAANPAAPSRVAEDSTTPGQPAGGQSQSGGSPAPGGEQNEANPATTPGSGGSEPAQGQKSGEEDR